jgi:hypothetical protein
MRVAAAMGILAIAMLGGCSAPRPQRLITNPDISGKIPAIKRAAEQKNFHAVPYLIKELNSDDPAVRFYAIEALQRLTGETFGYEFYADEDERKPAIARWQRWLNEQQQQRPPEAETRR